MHISVVHLSLSWTKPGVSVWASFILHENLIYYLVYKLSAEISQNLTKRFDVL